MFTGIVETIGIVQRFSRRTQALRLTIAAPDLVEGADIGDSVCVCGVCLTVVERGEGGISFDVVSETLRRSTLGDLRRGRPVNMERSLRPDSRIGGHFVMGHVDAVGTVRRRVFEGESVRTTFQCPESVTRYTVGKGSIAVDGVSLTVVEVGEGFFSVALIPHTRQVTTLGGLALGSRVNLELDLMAKYVEKLVHPRAEGEASDSRIAELLTSPS
ncbi:MAG: riboflavin synthase [Armatimonadetes bacterium]|nr:riboflavin synthase [Armatimonadota bacterium]